MNMFGTRRLCITLQQLTRPSEVLWDFLSSMLEIKKYKLKRHLLSWFQCLWWKNWSGSFYFSNRFCLFWGSGQLKNVFIHSYCDQKQAFVDCWSCMKTAVLLKHDSFIFILHFTADSNLFSFSFSVLYEDAVTAAGTEPWQLYSLDVSKTDKTGQQSKNRKWQTGSC